MFPTRLVVAGVSAELRAVRKVVRLKADVWKNIAEGRRLVLLDFGWGPGMTNKKCTASFLARPAIFFRHAGFRRHPV